MRAYPLFAAIVFVTSFNVACTSSRVAMRATHPPEGPGVRAVAIVRIATPWYAPRFVVRGKFRDALPEYEALTPLEAKYFTISDDGEYGGVYVWTTRADAETHFDAAWRAGVRERRGVEPNVLVMNAPYSIEGDSIPIGKPRGSRSVEYPASATFVRWELAPQTDIEASVKIVIASVAGEGLVRAFVVTEIHAVGVVALWATREAAETATNQAARDAIAKSLGATRTELTMFEAPLLVDRTLRRALR